MPFAAARSLLAVLLISSGAAAADTAARRLELPGAGALEISVPAAWRASPDAGAEVPTLRLEPASGSSFLVMISAFPLPRGTRPDEVRGRARQGIESTRDELAPKTVERALAIQEHRGGPNPVLWLSATDRAPAPGEHEHLVSGVAAAGRLLVVFTVLHHAKELPERAAVLRAMATARHLDVGAASLTPFAIALPGKPWAFLVDLPGFEMEGLRSRKDGRGVMAKGENRASGLVVSIFVEEMPEATGPEACRKAHFEPAVASPFEKADVRRTARDGMALGEYLIPRVKDLEVRQKHVNAYLARDGACVDLHVSKVRFEPADQRLLDALVGTARFGPPPR